MKKTAIILLPILLLFQNTFSQTKTIKGDTAYWFKGEKTLQKVFNLKNYETSTNEFNFRIHYYGQVIEIEKDTFSINGYVTNYVYHTKKANRSNTDTLFNKIILSSEKAKGIYDIIINSGILKLPSDNKINNWKQGFDGITYTIEHSDNKDYWLKHYWTPSSQDSIPEALTVLSFIETLSDSLNLQETYKSFENSLPKQGCYNSGGMVISCYVSNTFGIGYSGATKLPLGFRASYDASYIGRTKVNSGVYLQYNFSNNSFYHLNFQISKWDLLLKKSQLSDFVIYNYQNRKLNIDRLNNKFQNHQITYGLNLKNNFSIGTGLEYLDNSYKKLGSHLYASKYFSKPNISTVLTSSVFNDQINYKAQILKSFYLNQNFAIQRISLGAAYEEFMNYKDLYFNIQVSF